MLITVIGIGEVGSIVSSLLIQHYQDIHIHFMDIDDSIRGKLLDLSHAAAFHQIKISINESELLNQSDYIIYCAGYCNDANQSRNSVALENKKLIATIFSESTPKSTSKIIVVTNPVDVIAAWINDYFEQKIDVISTGTFLDTKRFQYILSKKFNLPLDKCQTIVLGEHGQHMVPIISQTFVDRKALSDISKTEEIEELTKELKSSAAQIRATESATKFGVAQAVVDIIEGIESEAPYTIPISVTINNDYKSLLNIETDISLGVVCRLEKGQIQIEKFEGNENELAALRLAAKTIEQVYKA